MATKGSEQEATTTRRCENCGERKAQGENLFCDECLSAFREHIEWAKGS